MVEANEAIANHSPIEALATFLNSALMTGIRPSPWDPTSIPATNPSGL